MEIDCFDDAAVVDLSDRLLWRSAMSEFNVPKDNVT